MMRDSIVFLLGLLITSATLADESVKWVRAPELTFDDRVKKWFVTFEIDRFTDVEVAIVNPKNSRVIRHLTAGVLGPKAPPPLKVDSRSQKLEWDGLDDDSNKVSDPKNVAVRVRVGMSVKLVQIIGGDPYAYFSKEMGHNDHSPFGINGLEVKSDGKVYVLGHSCNLGPPALRQYDGEGNYLRTVFPPPAGKEIKDMEGWGFHIKTDGTYTPKFTRLTDPSLTTTLLDSMTGGMARLFPSADPKQLQFWQTGFFDATMDLLSIHTDGTMAEKQADSLLGPLVKSPAFDLGPVAPNSHIRNSLVGPVFTCLSPDGKSFYLSGVYAATTKYGSIQTIKMDGPWHDGQVWKVDQQTRTAKPVFSVKSRVDLTSIKDRTKLLGGLNSYAILHGVAVDRDGNIFLCDRLNQRIVVLDSKSNVIREFPVQYPDAIAISTRTGVLYVTTRYGDEHAGRGEVKLLKYSDWRKDDKPAVTILVSETGYTGNHKCSHLAVSETEKYTNIWVAYTEIPVRIYRDEREKLTLIKDFYQVDGAQRCLGFDRIQVDQKTEEVYVLDDHSSVWKVSDWKKPEFLRVPLKTASLAIDPRNRHIYARTLADGGSSNAIGRVARYHLDQVECSPANFGETGTNKITPAFQHEWCFTGNGDKGIAVAPNGNLAIVGDPKDGLRVFAGNDSKLPWESTTIAKLPDCAGGVRFDLQGNLYVGYISKTPTKPLPGFAGDRFAESMMGRIYKYAPTGTLESGRLFSRAPEEPAKTYDVPYGAFDIDCIVRTPRFSVDGFGRIYYPTNIAQRVAVMDNEGNEILHFGTYGNRDSLGGLPGDQIPTKGIPMAFPNSVDATDNFIYVGDMVNLRLLRIQKQFQLEMTSR